MWPAILKFFQTYKWMVLCVWSLIIATSAIAHHKKLPGSMTGNLMFTSDYVFRGVSQTGEIAAIQGGFDWEHDSGFSLGVWASNVDFSDGDEAQIEVDLYGGYSRQLTERLSGDLGLIYYAYPGASSSLDYDYVELMAGLTYDFDLASVSGAIFYSPDFFGSSGHAEYYNLSAEVPLPYELTLTGSIGRQQIEDNAAFGLPNYTDWSLGLERSFGMFNFGVVYTDTDLSGSECGDNCDGRVLLNVSTEFSLF